jgi:hypothetical protein
MGVTPSPRPVVVGGSTGTVLPLTTVVPLMFEANASVCAMWSA